MRGFLLSVLFCGLLGGNILWAQNRKEFITDLENFRQKSLTSKVQKGKLSASQDYLTAKQLFWTPDLSLSVGQQDTTLNSSNSSKNYLQASVSLNLFKAGQDGLALDQAQALLKVQEQAMKNEDLKIEITASDLIFKSIYLRQTLRVQEDLFRLKEDSYKIIKERFAQGKSPLQEVTKAEVDLIQQKSKLRSAQVDVFENESQIQALYVMAIKTQDWPLSEKEISFSAKEISSPALEQSFWSYKASEAAWKSTGRSHWPTVDLTMQYQQYPLHTLNDQQWYSLLELKIPLWSKYETSAAISSAFATYLDSEATYLNQKQQVDAKKSFLNKKLDLSRQNLLEAKSNLQTSKKLYQDLLRSFRLGRLSINDLFTEQNRLLDSESNLTRSQLAYHQAFVEACALHGLLVQSCMK